MFDECPECGELDAGKPVDEREPALVCPECGHAAPLRRLPLLVVSGAAAAGKSTVLGELQGSMDGVVLLDSDVLWREELWDDLDGYFRTWLRLCRDVAQSGRPPVLFGTGFGVQENLERCPQYDCFSAVHYLALVCDDDAQRERLRARPAWRREITRTDEQVEYNRWLRANAAEEAFATVDTTDATPAETAAAVRDWIEARAG